MRRFWKSVGSHEITTDRRRVMSTNAAAWISKLRYGFESAPCFGSLLCTPGTDMEAKVIYCKALVYASCGGRLARDWIAGCVALSVNDQSLIEVALQHTGTRQDLLNLVDMLNRRRGATPPGGIINSDGHKNMYSESSGVPQPMLQSNSYHGNDNGHFSLAPEFSSVGKSESATYAITNSEDSIIRRCFVFDALKATSFHRHQQGSTDTYRCAMELGSEVDPPKTSDNTTSSTPIVSPLDEKVGSQENSVVDHLKMAHLKIVAATLEVPSLFVEEARKLVDEESDLMRDKLRSLIEPVIVD